MIRSCLYAGTVMHRRLRPRTHRLKYGVFWMLLDLDEIESLSGRLRLFSRNRFNAASFHDADHGDGSSRPLREQVEGHLRTAGIDPAGGRIELLCMPRILGYGFNPLSVYFCRRADGSLAAILYEVHNTFGERHGYLIPAVETVGGAVEQACDKGFFVSPFLDMDLRYSFHVGLPDDRVHVRIQASDKGGPMILASLTGTRTDLNDAALLRALATHPLLTLKVVGAIHWHALKMLAKGFRLRTRPPAPLDPVTVVNTTGRIP